MRKILCILFTFICIGSYSKELKLLLIDREIESPMEGVQVFVNNTVVESSPDGTVVLSIEDQIERLTILCMYPGYHTKKHLVTRFDSENRVYMNIESVIEGDELVIERESYKKEETVGTSLVVDKEEIKTLALRGSNEDLYNAIKTLPGISYTSGYDTDLAIRGGRSDEVTASLDGFIVRNPFYWGGSASIFNPNIVDSVKLSNGIFSVKYGMAMSGLLEVETIKPETGFRTYNKLSTSGVETMVQFPTGLKDSGCMIDIKSSISESTFSWLTFDGISFPVAPYIRDGYIKWFWKINDRVEWYINNFLGFDGISMTDWNTKNDSRLQNVKLERLYSQSGIHTINSTGFKILPNDKVYLDFLIGYEYLNSTVTTGKKDTGTALYSQDFKNSPYYTPVLGDSFTIDLDSEIEYTKGYHSFQTNFNSEIQLHEAITLGYGFSVIYDLYNEKYKGNFFDFITIGNDTGKSLVEAVVDSDFGDTNRINSSTYVNLNFKPYRDVLNIDLGCRIDHYFAIIKFDDEYKSLQTYPAVNPRLTILYTPFSNLKYLDRFTISFGSGLFSKMADFKYQKEHPVHDFQLDQQKTFSNVLGLEVVFPAGVKIKLEGYYKYYFNRYYANNVFDTQSKENIYTHHTDGFGHVGGFDFIIQKTISKYIDGWISYSFIQARYFNPQTDGTANNQTLDGDPTGIWFYPSYHRFHSMNLVLNIRPVDFFSLSPSVGVHSGLPDGVFTDTTEMTAGYVNNKTMEVYYRKKIYSDEEADRTITNVSLGFKMNWNFYIPRSKIKMEIYIAADDMLRFIPQYYPGRKNIPDQYDGSIIETPGIPWADVIPSYGMKISF